MTQGYGQQPGGQDQWGQGGQNPSGDSWGQPSPAPQQNQWGQPSPAAAPGGYPGAAQPPAGPQYAGQQFAGQQYAGAQLAPDYVNWRRVKLLGLLLLGGAALLVIFRVGAGIGYIVGADVVSDASADGLPSAVGLGSSIVATLFAIGNLVVSLAMLVIAIMAAVTGRGKARVGGIIVAVAIPVAVVLSWIIGLIMTLIMFAASTNGLLTANDYRIIYGVDLLRAILMVAVIAYGAYMVHSTARKKLGA